MVAFGPVVVSLEFPQSPPTSPSRNVALVADIFVDLTISSSGDEIPMARIGLAPPVLLDAILTGL